MIRKEPSQNNSNSEYSLGACYMAGNSKGDILFGLDDMTLRQVLP